VNRVRCSSVWAASGLVAALHLSTGCVSTPASGPSEASASAWLGSDRVSLFDQHLKLIEGGTLISERGIVGLGLTRPEQVERARQRYLSAATRDDAYWALLSLRNTTHDAHGDLVVPKSLRPEPRVVKLPMTFVADAWWTAGPRFVVSESAIPEVEPGFELERFDGRSIPDALREAFDWHSDSSLASFHLWASRWFSSRDSWLTPIPSRRSVSLSLHDPRTGRRVEVIAAFEATSGTRARHAEDATRQPTFKGEHLSGFADAARGIAIVRIDSFRSSRGDLEQLERFLDAQPPGTRVLLDVRENTGGGTGHQVLGLFIPCAIRSTSRVAVSVPLLRSSASFRAGVLRFASSDETARALSKELEAGRAVSSPVSFQCNARTCQTEFLVRPARARPPLPVALLIGPTCMSGCDQFAAMFADNSVGPVLGQPTRGASAPFRLPWPLPLANGTSASVTLNVGQTLRPNGEVLEGNPVKPTAFVEPAPTMLEAALERLASLSPSEWPTSRCAIAAPPTPSSTLKALDE